MSKTLIFVSLGNHVKQVVNFTENPNSMVVALDQSAERELTKRKIMYKTYHDYLTPTEFENINRASYSLMHTWLKNYDIKTKEGIGLGDLLATFYNIFSLPIKKVELVEKSILRENPTRVISISNSEVISKAIQHVCKRRNIPHQTLENSVLADTLDFVTEYLALTGLADFRKVVLDKMRISKFLKDACRPISSALVMNLFSNLYPFMSTIKLNRLILPLFDASMPKYYLLRSTHTTDSEKGHSKRERRILVLFTFENSVTVLAPVVKELSKKHEVRCVLAHPDSIKKCVELDIPFKTLGESSSKKTVFDMRSQVEKVRARWKVVSADKKFPRIFSYKGYSLYEDVKPSLFLFYNCLFVYAIAFVKLFENVLGEEKPSIVIVPDDTGLAGKAIVKLARTRDIPTLTVQHSTIDDVLHYKDVQSDIMAVWGKTSKDLLVKNGVPPDRLSIVGMPRFDAIQKKNEGTRNKVYERLGIPKTKKIAVWAPSPYDGIRSHDSQKINEETLRTLSNVFRSLTDKQLVVKLHPLDRAKMYKGALDQIQDNQTILVKDFDVYDLLYTCEFLMVCNSTTGLEAMAFDKPVIVVNLHNVPENVPYAETGAALRATKESELISAINAVSTNGPSMEELAVNRGKFLEDYAYKTDGKAAWRLAKVVNKMIDGND